MIETVVIILMVISFFVWLIGLFRIREAGALVSYLGAASLFFISGFISVLAGNMPSSALRIWGFEGPFPGMALFFVGLAGVFLGVFALLLTFLITFFSARAARRSSLD